MKKNKNKENILPQTFINQTNENLFDRQKNKSLWGCYENMEILLGKS